MTDPFSPKALTQLIEESISQVSLQGEPARLYEPMKYIMGLGGKRLRPLLALMSYNLFDDNVSRAVIPVLSIELFHNFSLIHDDIMDRAPVRRGRDTVHVKWDNNVAILSGDGLLVKAYELLQTVDNQVLSKVLKRFNRTAIEVCEGQQFDMDFETRSLETNPVLVEEYMKMIRLKTSVLFGFSLQLGAILAGSTDAEADKLYDAGVHLGLAFQLQDDLLDLYGGDKFGKIPGGDIINAKKTFMLVKMLELATPEDKALTVKTLADSSIDEQQRISTISALYDRYGVPNLVQKEIDDHLNNFELTIKAIGSDRAYLLLNFVESLARRTV